jgi:cytoskeleton protein RodZ
MGEAEQPTIVERVPGRFVLAAAILLFLLLGGYWYSSAPEGQLDYLLSVFKGKSEPGPAAPLAPPEIAQVPAPAAAPDVIQPVEDPPVSDPAPFGGLRVEFDDRSWIEVRDATQNVVFVGEYPAGVRQNVDGKPPFQIWIGKASGVRVYMGERSIDLKPHTREEVARFVLE